MKKNELINKTLGRPDDCSNDSRRVPTTAFAVTGAQVAADGTYTATAHVTRTAEDDTNEDDWDEYDVEVSLTVADGKFTDITVTPKNGYNATANSSYFSKAYDKSKGIKQSF